MKVTREQAIESIQKGGLIAYPTEAVFGLGCLPEATESIEKLLAIKNRPQEKGLILIASEKEQLFPYLQNPETYLSPEILASWPGPATWLLPAAMPCNTLLCGHFDTQAVRVSSHRTVRALCDVLDSPIISTSANVSGATPCVTAEEVENCFADLIDGVLDEPLGRAQQPSIIRHGLTGEIIRE